MNIKDEKFPLIPAQKSLLEKSARAPFMLGGFVSLDDILTKLKVDVHIEPGKPTRSVDDYYDKAGKYWRNEYEKLLEMHRRNPENEYIRKECQRAEIKLGRSCYGLKAHSLMRLLGLYDIDKNAIILYPEAMADADSSKMDEYLVSTFAHEVMHAYFNRPGHEHFPYAMFVEEPLAEFGMLLYLHETKSQYYNWAYDNVSGKKCCYGYGANIMDQYLGGGKSLRKYLEEYKIFIGEYEMLDGLNGNVSLPVAGSFVNIGAQPISANWTPVHSIPPTYFWDEATKTLGLDGDWGADTFDTLNHQYIHIDIDIHFHNDDIQHLYLGKDFVKGRHNYHLEDLFTSVPVTVSPQNKELTSINGIPVLKEDNTPVIKSCGDGCYELKRNGKYGIIDSNLKNITPFKYDSIWSFHDNGLCMVRIDMPDGYKYGYVNAKGEEQIAVKYDYIYSFENGLSVAKLNGFYGIINEKDEVVAPFNLDYPDMRGLRNGYATMKDYNGKWGAIDAKGQVVIPCEYDSLIVFDESGVDTVRKDGEEFLINTKGERLS
jgi:hypothetical protein